VLPSSISMYHTASFQKPGNCATAMRILDYLEDKASV
jgi:hypothetical protein